MTLDLNSYIKYVGILDDNVISFARLKTQTKMRKTGKFLDVSLEDIPQRNPPIEEKLKNNLEVIQKWRGWYDFSPENTGLCKGGFTFSKFALVCFMSESELHTYLLKYHGKNYWRKYFGPMSHREDAKVIEKYGVICKEKKLPIDSGPIEELGDIYA